MQRCLRGNRRWVEGNSKVPAFDRALLFPQTQTPLNTKASVVEMRLYEKRVPLSLITC